MSYRYEFLYPESMDELFDTFLEAFADYAIDISQYRRETFVNRSIKNGVDFESSVGLYDGERMVGYTLIGIDSWKGEVAAYDIGTGITKPHRGKGLARGMFDHALPRLRDAGVKTFVLEVLQQNEPAIKAYEKVGFRITRAFDCFELPCEKTVERGAVSVVELEREDIHLFEKELDWLPSWENSISSIMRVPDELLVYGAVVDGAPRGAIVYYPALSWIMLIAVEKAYRRRGIGLSLLRHLANVLGGGAPVVRIVNIQSDDRGMTAFLEGAGFERFVGQYEMELAI